MPRAARRRGYARTGMSSRRRAAARVCFRALLLGAAPLVGGVVSPPPALAADEALLRAGDRVVFFGDSITEQRLYTRYVEEYGYLRRPDLDVRFWNAGWGGDTAERARGRFARDVMPLKPTLVTLFFGMNDGGYRPPDVGVRDAFKKN